MAKKARVPVVPYAITGDYKLFSNNLKIEFGKSIKIKSKDIKKETKGDFEVIYVGRETCGWCAAFLPNLWTAQEEYDFTTLYIDIAKIENTSVKVVVDECENSKSLANNIMRLVQEQFTNKMYISVQFES